MTPQKRFVLGGVGALLPVLVSIATLDIHTYATSSLSVGDTFGIAIRYTALFLLGGIVTYLHDDEIKPFKLVELGIAAPALITSLVTANVAADKTNTMKTRSNIPIAHLEAPIDIIASAHATTINSESKSNSFFDDVVEGITGGVYSRKKNTWQGIAPNNEIYQIRANAQPAGRSSAGEKQFRFKLYLDSSKEGLGSVKQVHYVFLHPSFVNKHAIGKSSSDGFSYSYTGYGCLGLVRITIEFNDSSTQDHDFDMCRSLGADWVG